MILAFSDIMSDPKLSEHLWAEKGFWHSLWGELKVVSLLIAIARTSVTNRRKGDAILESETASMNTSIQNRTLDLCHQECLVFFPRRVWC